MLQTPMDVLRLYPVRKSKKQKQQFRTAVQEYAESLGYTCTVEAGSLGCRNVVFGDPEKAEYLITAHYDTPAGLPFPNLITPCNALPFLLYQLFLTAVMLLPVFLVELLLGLFVQDFPVLFYAGYLVFLVVVLMMLIGPANRNNANDNTSGVVTVLETMAALPHALRDKVCFVLFDLEEAGLVGSAAYRKDHKQATVNQTVLNMDCVGDGDTIVLFPNKKLVKDSSRLSLLKRCEGDFGEKKLTVRDKGFAYYPSDQKNFPYGVGICALRSGKAGLYIGRIHTNRDTRLDENNVNILRERLIALISG